MGVVKGHIDIKKGEKNRPCAPTALRGGLLSGAGVRDPGCPVREPFDEANRPVTLRRRGMTSHDLPHGTPRATWNHPPSWESNPGWSPCERAYWVGGLIYGKQGDRFQQAPIFSFDILPSTKPSELKHLHPVGVYAPKSCLSNPPENWPVASPQ